jgi:transposase
MANTFATINIRVRKHYKRYRQGGLKALGHIAFRGSSSALDNDQLALLDLHLQDHLYLSAKAAARWVEETFGVAYTESGMTALLQRLGYVYKKPKLVPGKADPAAQEAHLKFRHRRLVGNRKSGISWVELRIVLLVGTHRPRGLPEQPAGTLE